MCINIVCDEGINVCTLSYRWLLTQKYDKIVKYDPKWALIFVEFKIVALETKIYGKLVHSKCELNWIQDLKWCLYF